MSSTEIIHQLRKEYGEEVLNITELPQAYCENEENVQAIYLGCDPSNKHFVEFEYVFSLCRKAEKFKGFVTSHENSLKQIGLDWSKVYVQNLCQNYFKKETSKNLKIWKKAANNYWIDFLRNELNEKFDSKIPVFLTSEYLLKVLANDEWKKIKAIDFYQSNVGIPIPAEGNKLSRPLIPMYRHPKYYLKKPEWNGYKQSIKEYIHIF